MTAGSAQDSGDARTEILEDAGALDLLSQLQPRRMEEREQDDAPAPGWPMQGAQPGTQGWPPPAQAAQAWPPSLPNSDGFGRTEGLADWARPSVSNASSAPGGKKNPFKKPGRSPSGAEWATEGPCPVPAAAGFPDAPFPAFPSAAPAVAAAAQAAPPRPASASNPFRKDKAQDAGGAMGWPGGDLDAFQSVRPLAKEPSPRPPFEDTARGQQDASAPLAPQDLMAGARFAKESGVSAQDMMAGAQFAQRSGVTPQCPV